MSKAKKPTWIVIGVDRSTKSKLFAAAKRRGLSFSAWARQVLGRAAK